MISVTEWSALRGVAVQIEGARVSLQKVAVQFAVRRSERITRPIIIHCFVTSCLAPFPGTKGGAMGRGIAVRSEANPKDRDRVDAGDPEDEEVQYVLANLT